MTDSIENFMLNLPKFFLERFVFAYIRDQILVIFVPLIDRHAERFVSAQRVKESTTSEL